VKIQFEEALPLGCPQIVNGFGLSS
jgi:hypothetical protein